MAAVPGFVAKPGGGGRPVPSRHVSALTASNKRRLLWAPSAILSSVIDAFRKVFQTTSIQKKKHSSRYNDRLNAESAIARKSSPNLKAFSLFLTH